MKIKLPSQKGFTLDIKTIPGKGLSGRFMVPPFSILRSADAEWLNRKRQWLKLGIESEVGRGDTLLFADKNLKNFQVYREGAYETKAQEKKRLDETVERKYYYVHQESGCVWSSNQDSEAEGNPDGCTEECTRKDAIRFKKLYGQEDIPHHIHNEKKRTLDTSKGEKWEPDKGLPIWQNSGTSIFDPVLCELCYTWFCPAGGQVVDPFAGGSVRGIVANYLGLRYWGSELRLEQVNANLAQEKAIITNKEMSPVWVCGDALVKVPTAPKADMIFSCPPYGNLEVYSDLEEDLSNKEYDEFIEMYRAIIKKCARKLKYNRFACFVVSNFRDKKTGFYHDFVGDTIRAFEDVGLHFYNDGILVNSIGSLPLRAGKQFDSGRKFGKMHQNVLVFYKGDNHADIRNIFNQEL